MAKFSFVFLAATVLTALSANAVSVNIPQQDRRAVSEGRIFAREDELVYHQVARTPDVGVSESLTERDTDSELLSRMTAGDTVEVINAVGASGAAMAGNANVQKSVKKGWCHTKNGMKTVAAKVKGAFSHGKQDPKDPKADVKKEDCAAGTTAAAAATDASMGTGGSTGTMMRRSLDEQLISERRTDSFTLFDRANLVAIGKGLKTAKSVGEKAVTAMDLGDSFHSLFSSHKKN
ncbi:hypothetical protein GYMLUDRAFT_83519 [Collybiopsis luxurians FD-317 M1]|uniref:RxLR effector protein n=1 Tax=Collybiopsis luxurians FD-317 M1 TaxID=944289 RepID=A0A0D0BJ54_9AGAR|nr:hypothetical protein GYMLUDRAFT_83519 [Collybiopsis luxurians FD-317 M1]